jgi:putative nucleotidyltransferase with HDIG domain
MERITQTVLHQIGARTLALPAIPTAAFDCLELLRKSDFSMREAASVIEQDPALAARVLSVCNSAAFGAREKARSVDQAITRLGSENLRLVLFEATAGPIYESGDPRIRGACGALWRHSRAVASGARLAAVELRAGDPGEAYLAGLLHDIGKPLVGSILVKAEHRLVGTKTEIWLEPLALDMVQELHRTVGVALAQAWRLPETVIGVVANGSSYDKASPRSIVNCVRLVNALAKEVGVYIGRVDARGVADTVRAGQELLGVSDADLDGLRTDLRTVGHRD